MSVHAVLNAAYTTLANVADERDKQVRLFGGKDEHGDDLEPTARRDLDLALGLLEDEFDVGDESATTNVVELRAWVSDVNRKMR